MSSLADCSISLSSRMFLVWGGLICDLCLLVHVCVQWHVSMHVRLTSRVFLHQAPPSLSLNPRVPCFCLAGQSACSRNPRSTSQALGCCWVLFGFWGSKLSLLCFHGKALCTELPPSAMVSFLVYVKCALPFSSCVWMIQARGLCSSLLTS